MKMKMMMKRTLSFFLALVMVMAYLPLNSIATYAEDSASGDVKIDDAFPDNGFKTCVKQYDTDNNGYLSQGELAQVTDIDLRITLPHWAVSTLKGIEYFKNLKKLKCVGDKLTELDLSGNTNLTELDCGYSRIRSLKLPHNKKLTKLLCHYNQLTELDVSENNLTELDLSGNPNLTKLDCSNNNLKSLDVRNNAGLTKLSCYNNNLKSLDVRNNAGLTKLSCYNNELKSLDVSNNKELTELRCDNNYLTSLNLNQSPKITQLDCSNQQYNITVVKGIRKFKYSDFPEGFDKDKATSLVGATLGTDALTVNSDNIREVTYNYKVDNNREMAVTLNVSYVDFNPTSMSVTSQPTKRTYTEGETLDLSGLEVTLEDDNHVKKVVPFEQFTDNSISATPKNGTRLIAANHNGTVKLTYRNLSAYTDPLTVNNTVTYKDGVNGAAFQDQVKTDIVTGSDTPAFTGTPTRTGYVFAGWDPQVASTVTANAVYTATWKEDKNGDGTPDDEQDHFTVTYKDGVNGEAFADQVKSIVTGADTPKFDGTPNGTPTRAGYVFAGWDPQVASKVTENATYTATWKEDKNGDGTPDDGQDHFTVTYKDGANGEAFQDQVKSVVTGADTPAFDGGTPTRAGYVFDKWSPDVASKVTDNATYTATWKEDKNGDGTPDDGQDHFTVTYKDGVNGEAFPDQVKSIVSGAPTPAFDGTPTRTGYVFDKWSPDPEGTTVTGNATYVAQWKKPDSKTQHDKHIDMIPQTGESASYAGLLAALGFSITGLAILRKKKMMKENNK